MQFNIVIGNPPYNKGMDLDFIHIGYKVSNTLVCMITPAKWQTTADDYSGCSSKELNYKSFRELYVPKMRYICYYPCCKDIFNILQPDGIPWFIIKHDNISSECTIENKSTHLPFINSLVTRNITHRESLWNMGNEIVTYLGNYKYFEFPYITKYKQYVVWVNTQPPGGSLSTLTSTRKTLFIGDSHIEEYLREHRDEYWNRPNSTTIAFTSDNKAECESFISWLNTRFTQFFIAINISKLTGIITNDYFRFVTAPFKGWDKGVYTDNDMYNYYKLPSVYINFIESLVKAR